MEGSKQFTDEMNYPRRSPSSSKPILQFYPLMSAYLTYFLDTFSSYVGKRVKFLMVKESADGIAAADDIWAITNGGRI